MILLYLHKFLCSALGPKSVLRQHQVLSDDSQRLSLLQEDQLLDCTLHSEKCARLAMFIHTVDLTFKKEEWS